MEHFFITGIGTDVGKTLAAAVITQALGAHYWKPVQAGVDPGTDSSWIATMLDQPAGRIHPETYRLKTPASPHLAGRNDGVWVDTGRIYDQYLEICRSFKKEGREPAEDQWPKQGVRVPSEHFLVIEGAGGLMVPLNDQEFVADLISRLGVRVILVSRNYLGSINHSLLTALVCRQYGLPVAGWIFNDQYMQYEDEIVRWSGFPKIASIPYTPLVDKEFIREQAERIRPELLRLL